MNRTLPLRILICLTVILMFPASAFADITVSGKVTDSNGPVGGVTVLIKGTQTGIATDGKGEYKITVPNAESVLIFSFLGYKTQEITVGSRTTLDVVLESEAVLAEEVYVIGYGVQRKSHLTGSISKLEGTSLIDKPVSDVTTALQGMISGLSISSTTSEVGGEIDIRVRGISSVSAESTPLIVIDGYPVPDGLSTLNSNDIQSIEVLKDAASAAIYGSRAANGVIMVTTKSGTANKPRYSVKFYSGFKYAYKLHDLIDMHEYVELMDWQESVGSTFVNSRQNRAAAWLEDNVGKTDWQKEALRNAATINSVQLSVSGGRRDMRYYVSGSYTNDQGLMYQNQVQKVNVRSRLDVDLSKHIRFGINISGNYSKGSRPTNNFINFYRTPSFLPVYHNDFTTALTGYSGWARGNHFNGIQAPTGTPDANGNPTFEGASNPFSSSQNNPKSIMSNTFRGNESFQSVGSAYLNIQITKDITFNTQNGYNVRSTPTYSYYNKDATGDDVESTASYARALYVDLLSENMLTYAKKIGKHDINFLIGYTAELTRNEWLYMSATGFPTDKVQTLNAATIFKLAASNKINGYNDGTGTYRWPDIGLESYLSRLTYSYDDKYLMSASIRLDRSSLFPKNHRNGWFPSVSLGWRISEEDFMKDLSWMSQLKLRGSYGMTGNNRITPNAFSNSYVGANYALGAGTGSIVAGTAVTNKTLANNTLTWEKTNEFNVGFDLGVLKNRINVTFDAYYSTTKALLLEQPNPSFSGFTYFWNNIGKIRNKGLELSIETRNIQRRDFTWNTVFNFEVTRNKVLELGGEYEIISLGERSEGYIARVGGPLIQYYGYKVIGVWNSKEEIDANPHFATGIDNPGSLRVLDADGNGYLDANDMVPLGDPYPDFTWSMSNTLRYKNFDLSFLIQAVHGVTVLNGDTFYNETHKWNKKYLKNRWVSIQEPGDGKTPYVLNNDRIYMTTDYPLQDGSYVALRNVTLGYTLPKKVTDKLKISGLRVYASGQNLAYIWGKGYLGIDPESRLYSDFDGGSYSSPLLGGYQRGGFPITSTITFGIDVNF